MATQPLPNEVDIISYTGAVSMAGYEMLCKELRQKKKANAALLVLGTPGGDPHAGFRIARALSHEYERIYALIPRYCKSAGTLILIGAHHLYLDDMSELGPLDIQVKKGDEIAGNNSGLEFMKAVDFLQAQSMTAFRSYLTDLTLGAGLSTRVASDIAAKLAGNLLEPIAAQIDPLKLAEMQRATEIAYEYGTRLAEKSGNLRAGGLDKLVAGYPSHGFVIDRKEAKTLFVEVERPEGWLKEASQAFRDATYGKINNATPEIIIFSLAPAVPSTNTGNDHGQTVSDATGAASSTESGQHANDGNSAGAGQGQPDGVAGTVGQPAADNPEAAANDPSGPPEPSGLSANE